MIALSSLVASQEPARVAATLLLALLSAGAFGDAPPHAAPAVIVPIHGEINDIMTRSIDRRLEEARRQGVKTVIFEMDTPGGLVTSALDISKRIKKLQDEQIRTVAWVRDQAYSAGALISVACQRIVMSTTASIGDCAPIMIDPVGGLQELGDAERAKVESPVLEEFRESASRNGYNALLCRAMVTVGEEVWWIENPQTGEKRFVRAEEKERLTGLRAPAKTEGATSAPAAPTDDEDAAGAWRLVKTYADPFGKERLVDQPIDRKDTLLTMSQSEAVGYGFASGVAADESALAELLGLPAPPQSLEITGWEKFAIWLNSPLVRGILFVVVLIGAYIEFQSPGLILPGATALVALAIFLAAPYAAGLANIWTIVLLVLGLVLIGVEIFVLPGFGIAGILGVILVLVSFLGTFVPAEPDLPAFGWPALQGTWDAIKVGILTMTSSMIIAVLGIIMLIRYLPETWIGRRVILSNPPAVGMLAIDDVYPQVGLGDIGVVTGALRPGGLARFGQDVVDVHSQGEYVDAGRRVQVIRRDGMSIVVRPLDEPRA